MINLDPVNKERSNICFFIYILIENCIGATIVVLVTFVTAVRIVEVVYLRSLLTQSCGCIRTAQISITTEVVDIESQYKSSCPVEASEV